MKLITELCESVNILTEETEKNGKQMFIEGIFLQGNITNRNGRCYPTEILEREVNRYVKEKIVKKTSYGELGHPSGPTINGDRISHRIVELRRDGDNFYGKAQISSTPMGEIVKGLIRDGGNLGVSSRGMGSLKANRNGVMEVQNDFFLVTAADIVTDPSAPDAFVNGIMEGVEYIWNQGKLIEIKAEELKREIELASRARKLNEAKKLELFSKFINSI